MDSEDQALGKKSKALGTGEYRRATLVPGASVSFCLVPDRDSVGGSPWESNPPFPRQAGSDRF